MRTQTLVGTILLAFGVTGGVPAVPNAVPLAIDWNPATPTIAATCTAAIARTQRRIDAIVGVPSTRRTFSTVVLPIETAFADLNDDTAAQQFLENVASDKAMRDVSTACSTAESSFETRTTSRPEFYRALADAKASGTARTDADKKLTELWLTTSLRTGAALAPAQRAEYIALRAKLRDLENRYNANLANDATTVTLTPAQIAGLPPPFVASFKRQGEDYVAAINESTFIPLLALASDATARRAILLAGFNRGGTENVTLLEGALAIRSRIAHLFGYSTWAGYVLADKMAQSPARVSAFLDQLAAALKPQAEIALRHLSSQAGHPVGFADLFYEQNRSQQAAFHVDQTAISQYFPVQHTIDAVMGVYAKLLSVSFTKIEAPMMWDQGVSAYEIHDGASGARLGTFAFDLYPRPGKYTHFAQFPLISHRVLADGSIRAPFSVVVGNWTAPTAGHASVLTHDELRIFFHEFGHTMAAMLATAPYATLSDGFRRDFVEAPSQMLENWIWDPSILKEISSEVSTGKPMPDEMIAQLIASRFDGEQFTETPQVINARIDLAYHNAGPHVDTTAVWNREVAKVIPLTFPAGAHPQASFTHLMGGYDANYYGYLWSKVYAQDLFTAFATAGLEDPGVGMRYRMLILGPARTYEPDVEVKAFLGRPMDPSAFNRQLSGSAAPAGSR